ncbi:MAG: endolytic transglycosylase MltG [Magnetococcales bacterium]|nr:endolytic transglycosylase MltG [Magnetococcales bacterium]
MSRKKILVTLSALFILAGIAIGTVAMEYFSFISKPLLNNVNITIGKGWGLSRVATELEKKQIISSARYFLLLSKINSKGFVQAGEYRFMAGDTPVDILADLRSGSVVQHRISFPEGVTVKEMVKIMQKADIPGSETVLDTPGLKEKLKISSANFEGWFFPDTYQYTKGETAESLVTRMVNQTKKILEKEWAARPPDYKLTAYETLILASIIEKETGVARERGIISGVFHNRLRKKMKLQTDPTVIYGIKNFDGNITRKHLRTPTPYNTYTNFGLPPTPISNSGREAIHAAIHPESSSYLYFVSRGDGSHVFSKTFAEHDANVDCYQRKKNCKRVK